MAKIILRANLATNDFIVRQSVVNVELKKQTTPESIDVVISPLGSKTIDAANFYSGALPSSIRSISYTNSGKNVLATVAFNELMVDKETAIINLPITGVAFVSQNKLILTETYPSDKTVVRQGSGYGSSSVSYGQLTNSNKYEIIGNAGETVKVFERTFTAPTGFSFKKGPDYKINGKNYTVVSNEVKNNKGKITSKVFVVKYTFPKVSNNNEINNSIKFSYTLLENKKQIVKEATTKQEHKIYSINTGRDIGPAGGLKTITVTGVPGSPFKVLTSDTSNNVYNFKTGNFAAGGAMLEGVIPAALPGFSYGVYRAVVNVAPSTTGDTVQTRVLTEKPVNHAKIAAAAKDASVVLDIDDETKIIKDKVKKKINIIFNAKDGGVSDWIIATPIAKEDEVTSANLLEDWVLGKELGPIQKNGNYVATGPANEPIFLPPKDFKYIEGGYRENVITFFVVTTDDSKFIRINREPLTITNNKKYYVRWDGSTSISDDPYKTAGVEGQKILSDIGTGVRHTVTGDASDGEQINYNETGLNIVSAVFPLPGPTIPTDIAGEFPHGNEAFKGVAIRMNINGNFGEENLELDLNVNNFLTIHTA